MKKFFTILVILFITLPTLLPFFNSKFFYTQDYIFIARLNQMSAALSDGHFPVRWVPDLRFGEPTFSYYASLPYYIGAAIHALGFDFIWTAKILFILSTVLSAIFMYIFSQKLFGQKGAFLATVLYIYAPYRAVDLYVRGALSEAFSFVFFPLIVYGSVLLVEKVNIVRVVLLSLSLAGLFLTHNVTILMFAPFLGLWWLYLLVTRKHEKLGDTEFSVFQLILRFCVALVLGLGLAAFFLLPAFFEREFIQTKYLTVGYFDFRAHFVAFYQFFSPVFGYGSSLWGPKDDMSFQIGLTHWATLVLAVILGFVFRKDKKLLSLLGFLGGCFLLSVFLQHNKSAFLWEAMPLMAFIQFPWRFLAISIFIVSIIGAAISDYIKGRFRLLYFVLIVAVMLVNLPYFNPRNYVEDSFFDKFLNTESMHSGVDLTKDYFPIWVRIDRVEYFGTPRPISGEIEVSDFVKKTGKAKGWIDVLSDSQIEMPITYFPGWRLLANGEMIKLSEPSIQGLITFELPKGNYQINLELKDTPVRIIGNTISLFSVLGLTLLLLFGRIYKHD